MKKQNGITLLALIITIIILLILAGVTSSLFNGDSLIGNAQSAAEQSKIESKKTEIELAIVSKMTKEDGDITIDQIIEELEKKGIINEGDSNSGQVKTQPDGYIYEIKEDGNGNWEVIYIGKGEIDKTGITISVAGNTSGLASKVTLTIKANSGVGITKYTDSRGSVKTYSNGTTNIEETYEVTANGSYTFTVENSSGKTASKTVEISNILEGTIQISANPSTPTKNNVTVTVTWPSNASNGIKEISTNGGTTWQTGETSTLEVTNNCTVKARVKNSTEDIQTATLTINNIDRLAPNEFTPQVSVTSNSITISGSTTDNGSSGIGGYYYSKDNGASWQTNSNTQAESYTYTGLTQGTSYPLKMKAVDKAGNETIIDIGNKTTTSIAGLGKITITPSKTTPTKDNITVTVTWPSNTEGLTKQISKDNGTTWSTYTGVVTITENCTVKARLIDSTNQEGTTATLSITNIDKTNPTVTATAGTETITEGDSNAISKYFTYKANGTAGISSVVYTDTSKGNAKVTNTNTLAVGTHIIKCTVTKETGATASATKTIVVEKAGISAGEIASNPSEFGQYVTNYTTPSGDPNVKWRIFYADESNIYLIADDYIHYDYAPRSANYTLYRNSDYRLSFNYIWQDYSGSASITDTRIKKWIQKYLDVEPSSTRVHIRAVAFMLDETRWSAKYANSSYAEYAIGGPTLELYVASYNKTHTEKPMYCKANSAGYYISWTNGGTGTSISGLNTEESLYVIKSTGKANGMWLGCPAAHDISLNASRMMYIIFSDGNVNINGYSSTNPGFRPIVCLNSEVKLEKQSDGSYLIK